MLSSCGVAFRHRLLDFVLLHPLEPVWFGPGKEVNAFGNNKIVLFFVMLLLLFCPLELTYLQCCRGQYQISGQYAVYMQLKTVPE